MEARDCLYPNPKRDGIIDGPILQLSENVSSLPSIYIRQYSYQQDLFGYGLHPKPLRLPRIKFLKCRKLLKPYVHYAYTAVNHN